MTEQSTNVTAAAQRFPASAYLRGREVSVRLRPAVDAEPEHVWFKLTNRHVARIEEHFGGTTGFDQAFEQRSQSCMREFIAIALGAEVPLEKRDLDEVSDRMVDEEWPAYCAALETSWHLAHGGSVEQAGKVWDGKVFLTLNGIQLTVDITNEAVRISTAPSRGGSGKKRGRVPVGGARSSGT